MTVSPAEQIDLMLTASDLDITFPAVTSSVASFRVDGQTAVRAPSIAALSGRARRPHPVFVVANGRQNIRLCVTFGEFSANE